MKTKVLISKKVVKEIERVPLYISKKLYDWVAQVQIYGIYTIRMVPGFHDEPLKGSRSGQRSIRLNKAYRAIYLEKEDENVVLITILEVNKHEY